MFLDVSGALQYSDKMLQFAQVLMSNNLEATQAPCMNTSAKGGIPGTY